MSQQVGPDAVMSQTKAKAAPKTVSSEREQRTSLIRASRAIPIPLNQFFATLPFQTASTSSEPRRGIPFSLMSGSVASSIALRRKTRVSA